MPLRTGYIVRLLELALGLNRRKWCRGCVAGLGRERTGGDEAVHGGGSGRGSADGRVMLPWLDEEFIV